MAEGIRIVCLGDSARIEDLGITLHRGEEAIIPGHQAQRSHDLPLVQGQGLVSVKRIPLMAPPVENNRPQPGDAAALTISRAAARPGPAALPPAPVVPAPREDPQVVNLLRELVGEIRGLRADLASHQGLSADDLQRALGRMIFASPGGPTPTSPREVPAPEEVFIPSSSISAGEGRVSIETVESGTSGLDAAMAALRARKRGTP